MAYGQKMVTQPLQFQNAEACLRLTVIALGLNQQDAKFLESSMRTYAAMLTQETKDEQRKIQESACQTPRVRSL